MTKVAIFVMKYLHCSISTLFSKGNTDFFHCILPQSVAQCSQFLSTYSCNSWILCISGFGREKQGQRQFKSSKMICRLFFRMAIDIPIPQHAVQRRSPLSMLDVCVKFDTATVFTTGGYHMSRAKLGGMISAFV